MTDEGFYGYVCSKCKKSDKITEVGEWGGMLDLECKRCNSKKMERI